MRRQEITFMGVLLILTLVGCLHQKVEYRILEQGTQAGIDSEPYFAVVTSEKEFSGLYRKIHSGELPAPQPPPVDFTESFIVLLAAGEKPTSGYAVDVNRIVRKGRRLELEVRFVEPSPERMLAMVITRPYALVRVERQAGLETVVFVDPDGKRLAEAPLKE